MFETLTEHFRRPALFSVYSAEDLWTEDHVSGRMLEYHLDPDVDVASRKHAFIERATAWMAKDFDLSGRTVLDLGCGPGLYALELAKLGARVTGVDFSERSIRHARVQAERAGLEVDFALANYLEYEPQGTFDLICLIYGDYCALSPGQRASLLRRARRWLSPGGSLLLDVFGVPNFEALPEITGIEACPDGGFWSADAHFVVHTRFRYVRGQAYLDRYLVVEEDGHREIFNWIQCFDRVRLECELVAAGFEVRRCLGNVAGEPFDEGAEEFAVVATASPYW